MYLLTANQARSIYNLKKYIINFRKSALRVLRRAVFYFENTQQFVLLPAWRSVLENLKKQVRSLRKVRRYSTIRLIMCMNYVRI